MPVPLISIPLITYNGERFLRRQLDSIFAQTYANIEVIACDDCSTDGTLKILDEYRVSHHLKIHVNSSNLGFLRNFEKAISLCHGDLIAPSDQDDIWKPEKIESLADAIGSATLAFSDAILIDGNDEMIANSALSWSDIPAFSGKPFFELLFKSFVIGCTAMFKRDLVIKALPIPEGEIFHDWWLSMVASTMNGIVYIPEPLIGYRTHERNSIGLEKRAGKIKKLCGFLYTPHDKTFFKIQAKRLSALSHARQFTAEQRQRIDCAQRYFADRCRPGLHFKAFAIAVRFHRQVFPWTSGFFRFKAVLGALFR